MDTLLPTSVQPEQMRIIFVIIFFDPRVHLLEEFLEFFCDQAPLDDMIRNVLKIRLEFF